MECGVIMGSGIFSSLIQLQAKGKQQDEFGQPIDDWVTVHSVWANIRHQSGMETVKASAEMTSVKVSIRIQYLDGVTAAMRVLHENEIYSIEAVMPDRVRRQYVDLVCSIGANDG